MKGPSNWGKHWTSEHNKQKHFDEHGEDMGYETIEEYSEAATKFTETLGEKGVQAFRDNEGSTQMYNESTNEFAIINEAGKIITYFEPDYSNYFENQWNDWGDIWLS